jgi:hypothetical protein
MKERRKKKKKIKKRKKKIIIMQTSQRALSDNSAIQFRTLKHRTQNLRKTKIQKNPNHKFKAQIKSKSQITNHKSQITNSNSHKSEIQITNHKSKSQSKRKSSSKQTKQTHGKSSVGSSHQCNALRNACGNKLFRNSSN